MSEKIEFEVTAPERPTYIKNTPNFILSSHKIVPGQRYRVILEPIEKELRSCFSCGGRVEITGAALDGDSEFSYWIHCADCPVRTGEYYDRQELIEIWNRRVSDAHIDTAVKWIERAIEEEFYYSSHNLTGVELLDSALKELRLARGENEQTDN